MRISQYKYKWHWKHSLGRSYARDAIKSGEFIRLSGIALRISLSHVYETRPFHELHKVHLHGSRGPLKDVEDVWPDKPHAYTRRRDHREGQEQQIGAPPRPRLPRVVVVVVRSVVRTRRDILRFMRDLYNCTVCLGQGAGRHVYSILSISDRCTPFRLHEFSRAPSSHSHRLQRVFPSCRDRYCGASR